MLSKDFATSKKLGNSGISIDLIQFSLHLSWMCTVILCIVVNNFIGHSDDSEESLTAKARKSK